MGVETGAPAEGASKIYQDSSGGPNWDSANHVDKDMKVSTSFRGYRVFQGSERVRDGHRAAGWLRAGSGAGAVAVSVRDFWQNFPKALELRGNRLPNSSASF